MKIQSINPSFSGKRENIDAVINLDDNSIKQIALLKTAADYDYKKDKKIAKSLIYSAPIAAGLLSAAAYDKSTITLFSKKMRGLAVRPIAGLKTAAVWAAGLAALDLLGHGLNKLRKHSDAYRSFDEKHHFLTTVGSIAAGLGVLELTDKGLGSLKNVKFPEFIQQSALKLNKFLNNNELVKNASKFISENVAVLPKSVKNAGKLALFWAPPALILSGVIYSIKSNFNINKQINKNYSELKTAQSDLAKARLRELALKNDFLMQDATNREEIGLLENPLGNIDSEVA